jgi:glycosyltransferase involved in cell wall biosynthesis
LTELKGVQFVIPAFQKLLQTYPKAHLIIANAEGDYKAEIETMLSILPKNQVTLIRFQNDVKQLYAMFDVYVHVPIDKDCEAYGQVYIEALAMKVPSVFTLSGIANEFVAHNKNAMVVDYQNSGEITNAIIFLLQHPDNAKAMANEGFANVTALFNIEKMVALLEAVYHR